LKVYRNIADFKKLPFAVVTQGTFDGVHAGHKKILDSLVERAREYNGESVVLTFFPHPRMVLFPDDESIKLINTLEENIVLLEATGVAHLIVLEFTEAIGRLSAMHYVRDILVNTIGTRHLIVGYDHRFGRNREGNYSHLQEYAGIYNFTLEQISEVDINAITVSSTKIRNAILIGDMETASDYLQRNFAMHGEVVDGNKLGKAIGFPTANIYVKEKYKIIPADGVYAVHVMVKNKRYGGMLNIGNRPTINGTDRVIEVNIFNFDETIYKEHIEIEFVKRIRSEEKFPSLEDLKDQLFRDKQTALEILESKG
jgi:riboflavin kinase/FMN adenylyltransferase